jgi:hypothetical protein
MRVVLGPPLRVNRVCFWSIGIFSLPRGGSGGGRALVDVAAREAGPFAFSRRRRRGGSSSCTEKGAIDRVARRDIGGEDGTVIGSGTAVVLRGWEGAVAVS